jgi:hypothetical protein
MRPSSRFLGCTVPAMLFFAGRPSVGRREARGENSAQQLTLQFSAGEARLSLPHQVERFFALITGRMIRRGTFHSADELE